MAPRQRVFKNIFRYIRKNGLNSENVKNALRFYKDFKEYSDKSDANSSHILPFGRLYPIWDEFSSTQTQTIDGHYFIQDWYVAQKIFKNNPSLHVDIGSRIDGFISHLAVFREVEIFDIRPLETSVPNIKFIQKDLMKLDPMMSEYTDSLSCLHVIEHFGLGRYGDELDPTGHVKGIEALTNLLRIGGKFYFSVPIGKQRVEFNAHRIFSLDYLIDDLLSNFSIEEFSYMDDFGRFLKNVDITKNLIAKVNQFSYGLGIFELTRKK